jgi:transcriptional regulator with XRE-family HTH domain
MSTKDYPVPKDILPEHQDVMSEIGKRLQKFRKEKGKKSGEIAKEVKIGRNTYSRIEHGEIYFKFSTLLAILEYFKVSVWDFFKDLKK